MVERVLDQVAQREREEMRFGKDHGILPVSAFDCETRPA